MKSLRNLTIPEGFSVDIHFIFNNCDFSNMLFDDCMITETHEIFETKDEYKKDTTHHWKSNNFSNVIYIKNKLLYKTLNEGYDYFFLVDSDLILHKDTLKHLIEQQKDIIATVFMTKWDKGQQPMPNAWDLDQYSFRNQESLERCYWKNDVFEVGGTGACILINKDVIKAGVNYTPISNVSFSMWEDRAFCIRASVNNFPIHLSTHYPAIHLYTRDMYEKFKRGELKHE